MVLGLHGYNGVSVTRHYVKDPESEIA